MYVPTTCSYRLCSHCVCPELHRNPCTDRSSAGRHAAQPVSDCRLNEKPCPRARLSCVWTSESGWGITVALALMPPDVQKALRLSFAWRDGDFGVGTGHQRGKALTPLDQNQHVTGIRDLPKPDALKLPFGLEAI